MVLLLGDGDYEYESTEWINKWSPLTVTCLPSADGPEDATQHSVFLHNLVTVTLLLLSVCRSVPEMNLVMIIVLLSLVIILKWRWLLPSLWFRRLVMILSYTLVIA